MASSEDVMCFLTEINGKKKQNDKNDNCLEVLKSCKLI